jgi:hypothetical protein
MVKLFLGFMIFTILGALLEMLSHKFTKLAPYFKVLSGLFLIVAIAMLFTMILVAL